MFLYADDAPSLAVTASVGFWVMGGQLATPRHATSVDTIKVSQGSPVPTEVCDINRPVFVPLLPFTASCCSF